jgi:L-lactate dehydrogenase complex protein LldF
MESVLFALWARIVNRISLWNLLLKISRPLINRYAKNNAAQALKGPLGEWLKTRDLPRLPKKTFREKWKQRS